MIPYLEDVLGICQQFARNGVSPAFTLFVSVTPSNSRADEVVTESRCLRNTNSISRRTTGSPGVLGSEVTFVRFGSNMKPRYLGTSNNIIKVGIEVVSYVK